MRNDQSSTLADIPPPAISDINDSVVSPDPPLQRSEEMLNKQILCPSAPANENAILLGVVQTDGSVAFIKDRIEVSREFLNRADTSTPLETRFRFSSACHGSACKQWSDGRCSVPERLVQLMPRSTATDTALPACSIREQCRWFQQQGADACRLCPLVVTRGK